MGIKTAFAGPSVMEFGWEIMTWVPYLRKLSHEYDRMIICTYPGMEPLYVGFHCELEFDPLISAPARMQEWRDVSHITYTIPDGAEHIKPIKKYKVDGEYFQYVPSAVQDVSVLFHARGISVSPFKNWPIEKWAKLGEAFPGAVSLGTKDDQHVPGTGDARGAPLQQQIDMMASADMIIGQVSGLMHLATLCGCPQIIWGEYDRLHFGETIEKRVKETWNPFNTPVNWIKCDDWDPEPEQILDAIRPQSVPAPAPEILAPLRNAVESGRYAVAIAYIIEQDGEAKIHSSCAVVNFPDAIHGDEAYDKAEKQMTTDVKNSIANAKAERIPKSWA